MRRTGVALIDYETGDLLNVAAVEPDPNDDIDDRIRTVVAAVLSIVRDDHDRS